MFRNAVFVNYLPVRFTTNILVSFLLASFLSLGGAPSEAHAAKQGKARATEANPEAKPQQSDTSLTPANRGSCLKSLFVAAVVGFTALYVAPSHWQDFSHGNKANPVLVQISHQDLNRSVETYFESSQTQHQNKFVLAKYLSQNMTLDQVWTLLQAANQHEELSSFASKSLLSIQTHNKAPEDILVDSRTFERFLQAEPDNNEIQSLIDQLLVRAIEIHWEHYSHELNEIDSSASQDVRVSDFLLFLQQQGY